MTINQHGKETSDTDTDDDVLEEKLTDVEVPGFEAAFDPDEAQQLGAFEEDALSEEDAKESSMDRKRLTQPSRLFISVLQKFRWQR